MRLAISLFAIAACILIASAYAAIACYAGRGTIERACRIAQATCASLIAAMLAYAISIPTDY